MAIDETSVTNKILIAVSKEGARLFRNVRGLFLTLDGTRKVAAGLGVKGSSDLIGYTPIKITPEMVGRTIAVFTAIEVKTQAGYASFDQKTFVQNVLDNGGFAGIARNDDDAIKIIKLPLDM